MGWKGGHGDMAVDTVTLLHGIIELSGLSSRASV